MELIHLIYAMKPEISGLPLRALAKGNPTRRYRDGDDVANITGKHSDKWHREVEMIEEIAADALDELVSILSREFDSFVGVRARAFVEMNSLLCLESDEVRMVGIWGPPGIGKTTIAKAVHERSRGSFRVGCFMDNIKGSYNTTYPNADGTKLDLQQLLLSSLVNKMGTRTHDACVARESLNNERVLVVLDDVDAFEQVTSFSNITRWFGPGSRIIVIAEDRKILRACGINHMYKVDFPSAKEALQLFCRYTFGQSSPPDSFRDLAAEAAKLAGNLPLGLTVLGYALRGKNMNEWIGTLSRLRANLDGKVEEILRVSYDNLQDRDRSIFLHVACLFNGERADNVTKLLADSDLDVNSGLTELADRSLIHISPDGRIEMHPLLQQMGREIVRKRSIGQRRSCHFLLDAEETSRTLATDNGIETVLGISLNTSELVEKLCICDETFNMLWNLKFLRFYNDGAADKEVKIDLCSGLNYMPRTVRLLHWDAYPKENMPPRFRPEFLVKLIMRGSKLHSLWREPQPLGNLIEMDLGDSKSLRELPDLSAATNLEAMYLNNCESLAELPVSLRVLSNLKRLVLAGCLNIESLPCGCDLESLSYLDLGGCLRLRTFPEISRNIRSLFLNCTAVREVPSSVRQWPRLAELYMFGCRNLKVFPPVPESVIVLVLSRTVVEEVPSWIGNLSGLKQLVMRYCKKLRHVSPEIGKLECLEMLDFSGCDGVESFPAEIFQGSRSLNRPWLALENIHRKSLSVSLSEKASAASIACLFLTSGHFESIPNCIGHLSQLCSLYLNNCRKLVSLPELPRSLTTLHAENCVSLSRMCRPFRNEKLTVNFSNCSKLDQEARELIEQSVCTYAFLPGREVPASFSHRANGGTLILHLDHDPPVTPFLRIKACVVLAVETATEPFLQEGIDVSCYFRDKCEGIMKKYEWPNIKVYTVLTSDHVCTLDSYLWLGKDSDIVRTREKISREVSFEFTCSPYKVTGCGVEMMEEACPSSDMDSWHVCDDSENKSDVHGDCGAELNEAHEDRAAEKRRRQLNAWTQRITQTYYGYASNSESD